MKRATREPSEVICKIVRVAVFQVGPIDHPKQSMTPMPSHKTKSQGKEKSVTSKTPLTPPNKVNGKYRTNNPMKSRQCESDDKDKTENITQAAGIPVFSATLSRGLSRTDHTTSCF